jgi:hypothetical protein
MLRGFFRSQPRPIFGRFLFASGVVAQNAPSFSAVLLVPAAAFGGGLFKWFTRTKS